MNPAPPSRTPRPARKRGFTIIEMLVSLVVLILIVVMVSRLTNGASTSISTGDRHLDADSQARAVFSRMAIDFAKMIKRPDLDASAFKNPDNPQTGGANTGANDQFAFYAEAAGYFSGAAPSGTEEVSPYAIIAYNLVTTPNAYTPGTVLQRMSKGLGWDSLGGSYPTVRYHSRLITDWPNLFPAAGNAGSIDPDYKTMGEQVFRMEYSYLLKPNGGAAGRISVTPWDTTLGHTSAEGFRDVAAIVVAIAVLDSKNRALLTDADYAALAGRFTDAVDGSAAPGGFGDILSQWQTELDALPAAGIVPPPAASAVRIYERYFYLDKP